MSSKKKMSLEEYLRFLHSDREGPCTANFLNQIVRMHGFRQFRLKKEVAEAVKTMELMDPARSTLKENVSSRAFLELDEVVNDLDAIQWTECCLSGIQTLSSKVDQLVDTDTNIPVSRPREPTKVSKSKSKSRPGSPDQEENGDDPNATTAGGRTSSSAASTATDALPPAKKAKKFSASASKF